MDRGGDDGDFLFGICLQPAFEERDEGKEREGYEEEEGEAIRRSGEHGWKEDIRTRTDSDERGRWS